MQFYAFDREYVRRLAAGDSLIQDHFSAYFGELLFLKLRTRVRSPQLAEDMRQETLLRVIKLVREQEVAHPERFGALVSAVCNNVILELLRHDTRCDQLEPDHDRAELIDLDAAIVNDTRKRQVERVLAELPSKDRDVLRMYFLDELEKSEICSRLRVSEDYLRVLLHRAKSRFRDAAARTRNAVK